MSIDDDAAARKRYWAMVNAEQAKAGLPPIPEPATELPPALQKFKEWNRQGATAEFIAENQRRINAGLPALGVNGQPIQPKVTVQSEPPVSDPEHPMHAFFSGATDFEGKTPAGYENVKVKTAKDFER
jgi:hypothetical protein